MRELVVLVPFRESHKRQIADAAGPDFRVTFLPDNLPAEELCRLLYNTEIVIGEPELDAISASDTLRWVQMTWAGTDKYTRCEKPFPEHMRLTNVSGAFGGVMSEYAVSVILSSYRKLSSYHRNQINHIWEDLGAERTLYRKTVLIFGAGDIGTCTAEKLKAFGTFNVGVRRNISNKPECFDEMCLLDQSEQWLGKADIVICCIPNSDKTVHFLNDKRLRLMKDDALLINMGRGSFVVTDDLTKVLSEGHLLGAALDVTEPEPLPPEHPLWDMENVILTPHIAGPSFSHCPQTEDRIAEICIDNLKRYLCGMPLKNLIL